MNRNWLSIGLVIFITLCFGAGAYTVARSPTFYVQLAGEVVPLVKEVIVRELFKRMPPEQEAEMRKCHRQAGEWDNFRKRCRR
jgi:hypothetical protein